MPWSETSTMINTVVLMLIPGEGIFHAFFLMLYYVLSRIFFIVPAVRKRIDLWTMPGLSQRHYLDARTR